MKLLIALSIIVFINISPCPAQINKFSDYPISLADIKKVELQDSFWLPKIKTIQKTTIAFGLDKCEKEGRLENFLIAGGRKKGKVRGKMPFDDTDIYKIIEGASYSLVSAPNKQLETCLDSIIEIVKIGQEPDGYITTWFTIDPENPPAAWVPKSGKRWTREAASHELYNSGHLFEAAVAHFNATGKRNFLNIAIRNADLLVENFGPGKLTQPPGHQIVETGLIKLYRATGNEKYLKLAKFFLDLRGDSTTHQLYGKYSQDHIPVIKQNDIVGHAVRAVYMYAGMTDVAAIYRDSSYLNAVLRIWNNMIGRKIYLTGGIGARHEGESLGEDYELPNLTAYCETCASIGSVYWNTRLFMLSGDAKYFDIIERTLYNGLISGISQDGTNFFYVNPLEADSKFNFNSGTCTRQPWFDCSCCPTNLIRFIPSVPGLIYASQNDTIFVNLYASNKGEVQLKNGRAGIEQKTSYPWDGRVTIKVDLESDLKFMMKLRLPGWAQNKVIPGDLYLYADSSKGDVRIRLNGHEILFNTSKGYAEITRIWKKGDEIDLDFPMNLRQVISNKKVKENENKAALEYGPIVYCFEGVDNINQFDKLTLPENTVLKVERNNILFGGINVITGSVPIREKQGMAKLTAVPYYTWSNRGASTMKVWLPRN